MIYASAVKLLSDAESAWLLYNVVRHLVRKLIRPVLIVFLGTVVYFFPSAGNCELNEVFLLTLSSSHRKVFSPRPCQRRMNTLIFELWAREVCCS
jgi:hypothetical protein